MPETPETGPSRTPRDAGKPAEPAVADQPATSLNDPRVLQILSTEHWSLLSARTLAYNEAFTRAGMFLAFLSVSLVALALLAQGTSLGRGLLAIAAIVLGFDLAIGRTT